MKPRQNRAFLALGVLLCVTSILASVAYSGTVARESKETSQKKNRKYYKAETVTEAPLVRSKVKGLEITEVRLEDQGTPQAAILIDVTNNRDSAVISLDFISGSERDNSGVAFDGLLFEDAPGIAIAPHSLNTFRWFLDSIREGEPVFLAAAIFADGKEEGDKISLDGIKIRRKSFQKKQREEKAKNGGQP